VINLLGATETGALPSWIPSVEDWQYFAYHPALKGIEFREVGDGLYQLFVKRHPSTDPYHGTWSTFPHLQEYTMNDLYTKHPTKEHLWLYEGRADDVIVLSNGEKLNPSSMELTLVGHQGVKGALVVGQARFAPAVIIELEEDLARKVEVKEEREAIINALWPFVMEANRSAPGHAQLSRDKIIFSKPGKPFPRAPKGTVLRRQTLKLYEKEIDELYQDADKDYLENIPHIDLAQDTTSIETAIGRLIASVIGVKSVARQQDFFASGMDSLQVMKIARQLEAALAGRYRADNISRLIYTNTTVAALASALKDTSTAKTGISEEVAMQKLLEKYTQKLPKKQDVGLVVVLTGSTGSLGSYLLDVLASSKNVAKIYCLNRRVDAAQQQAKTNAARGLVSEWGDRVVFLHADLSKSKLGLDPQDYDILRNEANVIIRKSCQDHLRLRETNYVLLHRQSVACEL
jgi:hypothetical protein